MKIWFVLLISLSSMVWASDETLVMADQAIAVQAVGVHQLELVLKKSKYLVNPTAIDTSAVQASLSEADFDSFLKTRTDFLAMAAKSLQALKWGFGVGLIVKNHFEYRADQKMIQKLRLETEDMSDGQRNDILAIMENQQPALEQKWADIKNKSFQEKSNEVITRILNSLDEKLWEQAAIVAHANEFGVLAAVGLQAEGGALNGEGKGGLTDLGLSIGYNRDEKSLAIQIYSDIESFKSTKMPMVAIGGIVGKAGLYIAHQSVELSAKGSSYYPPMAPGFSSSTSRSFMFGASSGLTWPPSPIGDMLTYTNHLTQMGLLRISLSPFTKGFVRLRFGPLKDLVSLSYTNLKNIFPAFGTKKSIQCRDLF